MLYFNPMQRSSLYFYLVVLLAVFFWGGQSWAGAIPGQMVVKFKPGVVKLPKGLAVASAKATEVRPASLRALNKKHQVVSLKKLFVKALAMRPDWTDLEDYYVVSYAGTGEAGQTAREYSRDPSVERAGTNPYVRAFDTTPIDPYFLGGQQWALTKISAPAGWDRTTGTNETIVAVLDTGVNPDHEDLVGKLDLTEEASQVTYNYISPGQPPTDDYGHGTLVSGIIGAVTNNGKGIAGTDWNVRILPIKVLNSNGGGSIADVSDALANLAAFRTSTGRNIVAINMSLGQYNDSSNHYIEENPASLKENCQRAYDSGIVPVAAAGNGGVDWNTYPAYYPSVLAVAATDDDDKRSVWGGIDQETGQVQASNYGRAGVSGVADNLWVDVAAPGTDIYSTNMSGTYTGGENGTSFASPFVAGLVSLLKAANPSMTPAQLFSQIETYADNIDALNPGYEGKLGSGRINVSRALQGLTAVISSPATQEYVRGTKAVTGTASGQNFSSYEVDLLLGSSVEAVIAVSSTAVSNGQLASWDTTASSYGPHNLRLHVAATNGSSAEAVVSVTVDNISPTVEISAPAAGAAIAGAVTISGLATDDYLDRYILEYAAGAAPTSWQTLATAYASTVGVLGTWETAGLSGVYGLRLTAYDRAGNTSSETISVNILSQTPTKSVQPVDSLPLTFVVPNPFVRSSTSETVFSYSLAGNFNAAIYLFDLNGSLVWQKTYLAGDNGGKAGPNSPGWDGRDLYGSNVANGVYLYQITADKRVIARGKIIVLN